MDNIKSAFTTRFFDDKTSYAYNITPKPVVKDNNESSEIKPEPLVLTTRKVHHQGVIDKRTLLRNSCESSKTIRYSFTKEELEKIYDSYHVGQTYIDILGNNYYITKKLPSAIYFIRNRQLGKLNNDPICMGSLVFIEKMDYEFGFETHESIVNEYKFKMCCD